MKLLFLCSSLEPGRDGVGDYTRRLAAECIRQGHECQIVALYDKWISENVAVEQLGISVLRLCREIPPDARLSKIRTVLSTFAPDAVSLQFVCFGFHPKGIPWRWISFFKETFRRIPIRQIMFHEPWVDVHSGDKRRHHLLGVIQRWGIESIVKGFLPHVVHTSIPLYREMLKTIEAQATLLPLFSNIPVIPFQNDGRFNALLQTHPNVSGVPRDLRLIGLFFGTVRVDWEWQPLLERLWNQSVAAKAKLCLWTIGRIGSGGEQFLANIQTKYGGQIEVVHWGERPAEVISQMLQYVDFGIATTPRLLLGKSGSALAMIEHGLPMFAPSRSWKPRFPVADTWSNILIDTSDPLNLTRRPAEGDLLLRSAKQFLAELSSTHIDG